MGLQLTLIDGFELRRDGEPLAIAKSAQRVIAFLALHAHPLTRLYVAGALWPDVPEARSLGNLRSALWRVGEQDVVRADGDRLALARSVAVDARSIERVALRLTDTPPGAVDEGLPRDLYLLLSGELLPDWYEEWVLEERERLRDLRLTALEALGGRLLARGDLVRARMAAMATVRSEPLRESARRLLVGVYMAEGNRASAVRQVESYRRLLKAELGVEPSPQMDALVAAGDS